MTTPNDRSKRDLPDEFNAAVSKVLKYRPPDKDGKRKARQERRKRIDDAPSTPATPA